MALLGWRRSVSAARISSSKRYDAVPSLLHSTAVQRCDTENRQPATHAWSLQSVRLLAAPRSVAHRQPATHCSECSHAGFSARASSDNNNSALLVITWSFVPPVTSDTIHLRKVAGATGSCGWLPPQSSQRRRCRPHPRKSENFCTSAVRLVASAQFLERIVTVRGLGVHRGSNTRCELRQIERMLAFGKLSSLPGELGQTSAQRKH